MPANIVAAYQKAVKAAFDSSAYKQAAAEAHVGTIYESPAQMESAVKQALNPATVQLMKKQVPQSHGEAS